MQHLSRKLMLKETARRAAQAEQSQDYATARALWHQVYAASGKEENTGWAAARMLFCERQLRICLEASSSNRGKPDTPAF